MIRGTNWSYSEAENPSDYNLELDCNEIPGFPWYDNDEDRFHHFLRSLLGDDDGRTYSAVPRWREGRAP